MAELLKKIPISRRGWTLVLVLGAAISGWAMRDPKLPDPPPGTVWIDCAPLSESSGLARSRLRDDLLWTHNDSGDEARLFAIDDQGDWQATLEVKKADAVDWEDMCSFTLRDQAYLAVADVGDNGFARKHVTIYGLPEPPVAVTNADDADASHDKETNGEKGKKDNKDKDKKDKDKKSDKRKALELSVKPQFVIEVTYPNGPVNCEAIAYDPWREQFILLSKEQWRSRLFAVAFDPQDERQKVTARLIGTFGIPLATGAAISDDGQLLAVATYGPTCLLRRDPAIDWSKALPAAKRQAVWVSRAGEDLELIEAPPRRQGESICIDASGTHLLMTSEGKPTPLIKTKL